MRLLAALLTLPLCACVAVPVHRDVVPVAWVRMENVKEKCGADAAGCYEMKSGVCYIYTNHPRVIFDHKLHEILGHEVRHCFEGDFHPAEGQVVSFKQLIRGY